jgi:hypothetical protein
MTAIKIKEEHTTILDFSTGRCSKNRVRQALQTCEMVSILEGKDITDLTWVINDIKVGMYTVRLYLLPDSAPGYRKLKEHGDFEVIIFDTYGHDNIDLQKDGRFNNQYWVSRNFFGGLRVKHLVDIIVHCKRLDKLKSFL